MSAVGDSPIVVTSTRRRHFSNAVTLGIERMGELQTQSMGPAPMDTSCRLGESGIAFGEVACVGFRQAHGLRNPAKLPPDSASS